MVAVNNRIYFSEPPKKWRFFTDFLFFFGRERFGREWFDVQQNTSAETQHPAYLWRNQAYAFMAKQESQADGIFTAVPNGPMAACNGFYYDLYTVDNYGLLDSTLLNRLKHRDQFQGALHELFAIATCLRGGFAITKEDEKDRTRKHTEFVAIHAESRQHFLVEAKSRHRAGVLGYAGSRDAVPDVRFNRLLNEAFAKDPHNPLVVFVDTNLPATDASLFFEPTSREPLLPSRAMARLMDKVRRDHEGVDPYNVVVFSNHPQHYEQSDQVAPGNRWAAWISEKPRIPLYNRKAAIDLTKAVHLYNNVPTHFPPDHNAEFQKDIENLRSRGLT
jgi:hypothetical protein